MGGSSCVLGWITKSCTCSPLFLIRLKLRNTSQKRLLDSLHWTLSVKLTTYELMILECSYTTKKNSIAQFKCNMLKQYNIAHTCPFFLPFFTDKILNISFQLQQGRICALVRFRLFLWNSIPKAVIQRNPNKVCFTSFLLAMFR